MKWIQSSYHLIYINSYQTYSLNYLNEQELKTPAFWYDLRTNIQYLPFKIEQILQTYDAEKFI